MRSQSTELTRLVLIYKSAAFPFEVDAPTLGEVSLSILYEVVLFHWETKDMWR